jgi:hypothetical protein
VRAASVEANRTPVLSARDQCEALLYRESLGHFIAAAWRQGRRAPDIPEQLAHRAAVRLLDGGRSSPNQRTGSVDLYRTAAAHEVACRQRLLPSAPARLVPFARHQPAAGVTMLVGELLDVAQMRKLHTRPR